MNHKFNINDHVFVSLISSAYTDKKFTGVIVKLIPSMTNNYYVKSNLNSKVYYCMEEELRVINNLKSFA